MNRLKAELKAISKWLKTAVPHSRGDDSHPLLVFFNHLVDELEVLKRKVDNNVLSYDFGKDSSGAYDYPVPITTPPPADWNSTITTPDIPVTPPFTPDPTIVEIQELKKEVEESLKYVQEARETARYVQEFLEKELRDWIEILEALLIALEEDKEEEIPALKEQLEKLKKELEEEKKENILQRVAKLFAKR